MSAQQVTEGPTPSDELKIREMEAWDREYIMVSLAVCKSVKRSRLARAWQICRELFYPCCTA
jgi:hypothetical protein